MKAKLLLIAILPILLFANHSLYNIDYQYIDLLVRHNFDIVEADPRFGVDIVANEYDRDRIDNMAIPYEIKITDMESFYRERLAANSEMFGAMDMGGYKTYSETVEFLDSLYEEAPDLMTEKFSIGQSIQENDLWVVKMSDNPEIDEEEPEVFFDALIHAREVITHEVLMYFMRWLADSYGDDPMATYILDHREVYFMPVVNPDGVIYNEIIEPSGGGMWRKNRRNNGDGTYGVDLNRNYGYMWGYDDTGSSPDPSSNTYRGTSPFSEPESQAYRDFVNEREFVTHLNIHSYSALYLHPWGYNSSVENPDDFVFNEMGAQLGKYNGYPHGADLLYDANGGVFDWMYGDVGLRPKIFSFTPEIGYGSDGFWPSLDRKMPLILSQQWPLIYMCLAAGSTPMLENYSLSDTSGNDSGYPDAGEIITIQPEVKNYGIAEANNVYAYCNPIYGIEELIADSVYIGNIASFIAIESDDIFRIKIDSSLMFDELCILEIEVRDPDGYLLSDTIEFSIGTPEVIAEYDFEEPSGFSASGDWERGIPTHGVSSAYNGEKVLATKLNSDYSNNTTSTFYTDGYSIPEGLEYPRFSFWHWYSTEADTDALYDGGNIKISVDGGPFTVVEPEEGYDGVFVSHSSLAGESCFAGNSNGWKKCTIDLSTYAGHNVQFQLDFCSDPYVTAPGWYIDDMMVYGFLTAKVSEFAKNRPQDLSIKAFPNPFNSRVDFDINYDAKITIMDINGKIIEELDQSMYWEPSKNIQSGMYIINAEDNEQIAQQKVFYIK